MTEPNPSNVTAASRRDFLKTSTIAATAATGLGAFSNVHAAGSDTIKVGLIGCGGRGSGAADQSMRSAPNIKLYAMGDMFQDNLDHAKSNLSKKNSDKFDVTSDRCFVGFDAYKGVINSGVDLVLLATPPGFRPIHIAAVIEAGKHLFSEKPVAVDGPGIRMVLAAAVEAKQKNLAVVAGTQRRHQAGYLESMKRVHAGDLGEITSARCYWNQGSLWMKPRQAEWSDMEWQLRNWLYFTWLSGDHICEQHIHNIDVINWAMQGHPVSAMGMGGRQVRTSPDYGNIFDHFAIDYTYENGAHCMSMCRQIPGCANSVSEDVVGTKGALHSNDQAKDWQISGENKWEYGRARAKKDTDPYLQEHIDLIASLRDGRPLNELQRVAESTLTAIMGRMSAYTGKAVTWEQALESEQNLLPPSLKFGPLATPAIAVPGETELI
jgi:predicted dehydrogenase